MLVVHGVSASPFVRKVRAFLLEKGVAHESKPVFPGGTSPEWRRMSPLGKVPVLQDGATAIPDSSVICLYLEKKHPTPRLYPEDPASYAHALWLEEWADTAFATVAGGKIFFPRVVAPFLKQPADEAGAEKAIREELPPLLDYLEGEVHDGHLVGSSLSIADLSVASHFVNLGHAQVKVDAARWPKLARYVDSVLARPSFRQLIEEDRALFR